MKTHATIGKESLIAQTIVIVKASFSGKCFHVLEVHLY